MQIRRKPRKSPINDFVSMIVPDRIEEAYDRVENYFTQHLHLTFGSPEGVAGVLNELIRDHGVKVRKALYAMLCEENGPLRPLVSGTTATGAKSAVGFLVPVLAAQFALAPAVALLVATLVIKTAAAHGEKSLCEELIRLNRKTTRHLNSIDPRKRAGQQRSPSPRRNSADAGAESKPARRKRSKTGETVSTPPRLRNTTATSVRPGVKQKPARLRRGTSGENTTAPPRPQKSPETTAEKPRRRTNRKSIHTDDLQ
jgi:hypothetical protein